MADLSSSFTSPKEEKKKIALPKVDNEGTDCSESWKTTDSSTMSVVDADVVLNDSDYRELYANEVSVSDKAHLRCQARKKLKAKGVRRKTTKKSALAYESEDVLKERIKQLSVELNRRNSATKTDDEGPETHRRESPLKTIRRHLPR